MKKASRTKKSFQTEKFATNLNNSSTKTFVKDHNVEGHNLRIVFMLRGRRADTLILPLSELEKIPKEDILEVTDLEAKPYPVDKPSEVISADNPNRDVAKDIAEWETKKKKWEETNAIPPHLKDHNKVKCNVPVIHVVNTKMDGYNLRIYHTLRGPIMGAVMSEDSTRVQLYSPAYIDPNIERGRIHFLPIAFAGFNYTLYRTNCIGESEPQEAEIMGFPSFVERNKKGDYQFRSKTAYHHVDADLPDDSLVISADMDVRAASEGVVVTSDTKERKIIDNARMINRTKQA